MYEFGGLYMDADYELYRVPTDLFYNFDFVTANDHWEYQGVAAGVFAAKPKHPIVETWL